MIELIVAISRNRIIGSGGDLPWHLPGDLKHFKELTLGGTVLMGRKTWESLPERFRPLPERRNIVVTRNAGYDAPGAELVASVQDGLAAAGEDCFVIGGAQVFEDTMAVADRLRMTYVDADIEGDTRFPPISPEEWALADMSAWHVENGLRYRFEDHNRVRR